MRPKDDAMQHDVLTRVSCLIHMFLYDAFIRVTCCSHTRDMLYQLRAKDEVTRHYSFIRETCFNSCDITPHMYIYARFARLVSSCQVSHAHIACDRSLLQKSPIKETTFCVSSCQVSHSCDITPHMYDMMHSHV